MSKTNTVRATDVFPCLEAVSAVLRPAIRDKASRLSVLFCGSWSKQLPIVLGLRMDFQGRRLLQPHQLEGQLIQCLMPAQGKDSETVLMRVIAYASYGSTIRGSSAARARAHWLTHPWPGPRVGPVMLWFAYIYIYICGSGGTGNNGLQRL